LFHKYLQAAVTQLPRNERTRQEGIRKGQHSGTVRGRDATEIGNR